MGKVELKIEVDEAAVARAEASGVDLVRVAQEAVAAAIASSVDRPAGQWTDANRYHGLSDEQKAQRWAEENAAAILAQRERIESCGVFGEDLRTW